MNQAANFKGRFLSLLLMAIILCVFSVGCATNRGYVKLDIPVSNQQIDSGQPVFIKSVIDNRKFEDKPRDPSIPSLGFGGLAKATDEQKKRAIARKRNSWGKALGDILLEEGQTVETIVADLLEDSLRSSGYKVVENMNNPVSNLIILDVVIDKFWAWFTPGFATIATEAEIETPIKFIQNDKIEQIVISAYARKKAFGATGGVWKDTFDQAFKDYKEKAMIKFKKE